MSDSLQGWAHYYVIIGPVVMMLTTSLLSLSAAIYFLLITGKWYPRLSMAFFSLSLLILVYRGQSPWHWDWRSAFIPYVTIMVLYNIEPVMGNYIMHYGFQWFALRHSAISFWCGFATVFIGF
ncbi:MAG: hypothetical protein R3E95_11365 [Thiolinea sp.]